MTPIFRAAPHTLNIEPMPALAIRRALANGRHGRITSFAEVPETPRPSEPPREPAASPAYPHDP